MRRICFIVLLLLGVASAGKAQTYPYLAVQTTEGEVQTLSVDGLTMRVADGQMTFEGEGTSVSVALASLSKMYFASSATGVKELATSNSPVQVYVADGRYLGKFETLPAAVSGLRSGVYVVKSNDVTLKISVQ